MECLLAAIFVLILLTVPLSALGLSIWPSHGEDALKQVAKRFGGSYSRGSWFRPARVNFRYGAASAVLRIMRGNGRTWVEIAIHGTRPGARLEIAPSGDNFLRTTANDATLRAVYTVKLESVRYYTAYAEQEHDVQKFLSDPVVVQLKVLQKWGDSAPLVVAVEPGELVIRKQWNFGVRSADLLIEFTTLTMRLHDYVLLGKEQGIEFVQPAQTPMEHVKCAICGEPMGTEYVVCRQCSAPHHLECWKYNGLCGMFACKETKYEVVRTTPFPTYTKNVRWQ